MSYTVKAELHPKATKRGERSILIRITHQRKRVRMGIGKQIDPKFWDMEKGLVKQAHPLSVLINGLIKRTISDAEKIIFEHLSKGDDLPIESLSRILKGHQRPSDKIHDYALNLCDRLDGKFVKGSIKNLRIEAERINRFHPGITFERVNVRWLSDYESHLRSQGFTHNTVHKCFKTLAKFFNSAIKEEVTTNYPFKQYDRPRYRQGDRTYLNSAEVSAIEGLLDSHLNIRIRKACLWFLFGCFTGLRFSDWQRFNPEMIRGNDIVIRAKKNGQLVIMPIHSRLAAILEQLKPIGPPEAEQNTNVLLKAVATMAGIGKNLTTHVARHSFAVRCAELGISIETTAELLGVNVKTCSIYYKVTGSKVRTEMAKWG